MFTICLTFEDEMKLLRYGDKGFEKPGLMDSEGDIRDLSAVVDDITGAVLDCYISTIQNIVETLRKSPANMALWPNYSR